MVDADNELIAVILGDGDLLDRAREMIARHEGIRLKPYLDTVGKMTVGYGRNLTDVGISQQEASFLLENDIKKVIHELIKIPWFNTLNPARKAVLIDMAFNLGISGLMKFRRTLQSIETGQYELAAKQMLQSKWARQVGTRAKRLAHMMQTGAY